MQMYVRAAHSGSLKSHTEVILGQSLEDIVQSLEDIKQSLEDIVQSLGDILHMGLRLGATGECRSI